MVYAPYEAMFRMPATVSESAFSRARFKWLPRWVRAAVLSRQALPHRPNAAVCERTASVIANNAY